MSSLSIARSSLLSALCSLAVATAAVAETPRKVNVPAGELASALKSLSEQVDVNLVYAVGDVAGVRTSGVSGTLTRVEAVQKLLEGTDLRLSTDVASGAMLIAAPATDSPPVGVNTSAALDAGPLHGGRIRLAQAEETANPESQNSTHGPEAVETVTVTGSRLGSTNAIEEGPAPVHAITFDEIRKIGATTVHQALIGQPEFTGYAENGTYAGNVGNKGVNLRGLGMQYTLVLIDGRRAAAWGDLNLIPFAAIDRIEILKDGASAAYGSDALAGVVNVILRKDYEGLETNVSYGNTTHFADGARTHASFLSGLKSDRGNFMLSGEYEKENRILSLQHPMGRTDDQRLLGGSTDWRQPRLNPGVITLSNGSQVMLDSSFGTGQTGTSPADYVPAYTQLIEKSWPNDLQNPREFATILARGSYNLADERAVLYADYLHKSGRLSFTEHNGTLSDSPLVVPASNYWNPFGEDVTVNYQLDYGTAAGRQERPLETMTTNTKVDLFTTGLRGALGPVDYDLSYTDYVFTTAQLHDGLSRAGILAQLARTDAGALNLFGNAAVTPEQLEPARAVFGRDFKDFMRSFTGTIRFSPLQLPAGRLGTALGFETRTQGESGRLDEALNTFHDSISLTYLNDSSYAIDRDVDAYFVEAGIPIASKEYNFPGVRDLSLTLAARREKFSDFGSATVSRAALRWEPFESGVLAVRASYSESFLAPSVFDLVPGTSFDILPVQDPSILDENGNPIQYDITSISGGNPDLAPTEGEYVNLGFIIKPPALPGLTLTTDLWSLDQTEAFIYPSAQAVVSGIAPGEVTRDPVSLPGEPVGRITEVRNPVTNAATRKVQGIDVNVEYVSEATRFGRWSVASYNTFTTKFEFDDRDGSGVQSALGRTSFDVVPRFRSNLMLGNEIGPWNFNLITSYTSHLRNTYEDLARIDAYTRTDLTVSYDFDKRSAGTTGLLAGTQVTLTVDDVFDEGAPFWGNYYLSGVPSNTSYVDLVGQFVTLSVRKRL